MVKIAMAASAIMVTRATNITVIAARTISSSLGRHRGITFSARQPIALVVAAGLLRRACAGVAVVISTGPENADPRIG
jgi:hypothetical protein